LPNLCVGISGTPPACRNKHRNGQWPISCQVVARQRPDSWLVTTYFRCSFGRFLLL